MQQVVSSRKFALVMAATTLAIWVSGALFLDNSVKLQQGVPELTELEALGDLLFNDISLSEPEGLSCGGCHDARLQLQGNNGSPIIAVAVGSRRDAIGSRNPPSIAYSGFTPPFEFKLEKDAAGKSIYVPVGGLFLDGRAATLELQVTGPLFNVLEMNNKDAASFAAKLARSPTAPAFRAMFGDIFDQPDLVVEKVVQAITAYERSTDFARFGSKFDKVLQGRARFTALEAEGFRIFKDPEKGNCIACHVGIVESQRPEDWLFTDFTYDVLAPPRNRDIPSAQFAWRFDLGLCMQKGISLRAPAGFDINSVCGAFKVPSLRNVAVTGPYFHNGSVKTLRDAVAFYATRDIEHSRWYGNNPGYDDLPERYWGNVNRDEAPYNFKNGRRLSEGDIDALAAFLETLTDPQLD